MIKVRINDLAREMEVKSKSILDALIAVGVTEKKTHSSSIEEDEAEKVRGYFNRGSAGPRRFKLPVSVGKLMVERGEVRAEIVKIVD